MSSYVVWHYKNIPSGILALINQRIVALNDKPHTLIHSNLIVRYKKSDPHKVAGLDGGELIL